MTANADRQTEHNQMPHVHVHSCTCRYTVLCYIVLPLYTRRLVLKRRTVLHLYTLTIIEHIGQNPTKFLSYPKYIPSNIYI